MHLNIILLNYIIWCELTIFAHFIMSRDITTIMPTACVAVRCHDSNAGMLDHVIDFLWIHRYTSAILLSVGNEYGSAPPINLTLSQLRVSLVLPNS